MTRGRPFRVRCHICTLKGGAKPTDGYNVVRTGKQLDRMRTFGGVTTTYTFREVRCLDCRYVFETRLEHAAKLPLEET